MFAQAIRRTRATITISAASGFSYRPRSTESPVAPGITRNGSFKYSLMLSPQSGGSVASRTTGWIRLNSRSA